MLRFISVLASIFIVGYLIVRDTWMVTITAFGYEIRTSLLVVIMAFCLFLYLLHLLKKPFHWFSGYRRWSEKRRQSKKEAYLLQALRTVLDRDSRSATRLLRQKNAFFDRKSDENYILEALFQPTPHTFEQLLHREDTELAGIRGLLTVARQSGDWDTVERLLLRAADRLPGEPWIWQELWEIQVLQRDWNDALATLDRLKKQGQVTREQYAAYRAGILLKLGRVAEAYKLQSDHPAIALAYAAAYPSKAMSVLTNLWRTSPSREAFLLFRKAVSNEKPAKQEKLLTRLIQTNPEHRGSLLAKVQLAMDKGSWPEAKEQLEAYLNVYPLTATVARLMAEVERQGWHHEEEAKRWDLKAAQTDDDTGWGCSACGHRTAEWDLVCPRCNAFGTVRYK